MKLYIIVIDEVDDGQVYCHEPLVCLDRKRVKKELIRLRDQACRSYHDELEDGSAVLNYTPGSSLELFLDGEYCLTHYTATVHEVEVKGAVKTDKYVLKVAYGEQCTDHVCDLGWAKTQKALDAGEIEGSIQEYEFETENDLNKVAEILNENNGYSDNYYEAKFPNVSVSDYFISFDMMSEEDTKDITDSNLLESGLVIAKGKNVNGITFTIETQGEVRILWNGEIYKYRKDFPEELVDAISSGSVEEKGGEWIDNNWYEFTIIGNNGECLKSDLFDICLADLTEDELKALIKDEIKNVINK